MNQLIELQAQDIALEAFRIAFPLRCTSVTPDGLKMIYRLRRGAKIDQYAMIARLLIIDNLLPLEVKIDVFAIGGMILENNLIIEFVPSKSQLPCY